MQIKTFTLGELNNEKVRYTEAGLLDKNLTILKEHRASVVLNRYVLQNDTRLLIPFEVDGKIGLLNHEGQVVVQPLYDEIDDCLSEDAYLHVRRKCFVCERNREENLCGLIDTTGKTILPLEYRWIIPSDTRELFSVQNMSYQHGVLNKYQKEVIPFGKFSYIGKIVHGFVRIRTQDGWGVSDLDGELIINGLEEIWDFNEKYDSIVVKKDHVRYSISFTSLEKFQQDIKSGKGSITLEDILEYEQHLQRNFDDGLEVYATLKISEE